MINYINNYQINDYDLIVIGAGLTGAIIARECANAGKKVLIIEKRNHIGGNLYDYIDGNGLLIQKYGPHVFHTNEKKVYDYINNYIETFEYITKCSVYMHNKFTPSPFNFKTIEQYFNNEESNEIKKELINEYPNRKSVTIVDLLENKNPVIKKYAQFLFDSDYSLYTAKQWGIEPKDVDPNVLKRVPILLNYDEQYFYDTYQFMPKSGFTQFILNLLESQYIDVLMNTDFQSKISIHKDSIFYNGIDITEKNIIYTGEIDRLFNYKYGKLPYRSLKFEFKTVAKESFQKNAIVAYPEEKKYTRITEFSKIPYQKSSLTTIAYEYPLQSNENSEPYYPIINAISKEIYGKYLHTKEAYKRLYVCGRLGDFSYYNMDQTIMRALSIAEIILNKEQ